MCLSRNELQLLVDRCAKLSYYEREQDAFCSTPLPDGASIQGMAVVLATGGADEIRKFLLLSSHIDTLIHGDPPYASGSESWVLSLLGENNKVILPDESSDGGTPLPSQPLLRTFSRPPHDVAKPGSCCAFLARCFSSCLSSDKHKPHGYGHRR
jgi:hypothetical protein